MFRRLKYTAFVDKFEYCDTLPSFLKGVNCISSAMCLNAEYGLPTMDCIFHKLVSLSSSEVIGYMNADVFVQGSLMESLSASSSAHKHFVMVGRRRTIEKLEHLPEVLRIDWKSLESSALSFKLDGGYAVDYFFSRRTSVSEIMGSFPPFLIGVHRWDNVLLSSFMKSEGLVV